MSKAPEKIYLPSQELYKFEFDRAIGCYNKFDSYYDIEYTLTSKAEAEKETALNAIIDLKKHVKRLINDNGELEIKLENARKRCEEICAERRKMHTACEKELAASQRREKELRGLIKLLKEDIRKLNQ